MHQMFSVGDRFGPSAGAVLGDHATESKVSECEEVQYVSWHSGITYEDFISKVKEKFGLPDATELDVFDDTDTAVDEDIITELLESNPDVCLTVREKTSDEDHSTPSTSDTSSSLTDTLSLSSSDSDLRDKGIPTGRSRSSIEGSPSAQMVKNALLGKSGGEDILEEYRSENSLKHHTRRQLVNILASHMTERHGHIPTRQQREKYALGIVTLFPALKDPFSSKGYVNLDFTLLFGIETSSKLLNKWDTTFKLKIIKEATQLTQSTDLCRLLKAAERHPENDSGLKKRTKISPSDAADKMVLFHKSCSSIDEHLQEKEGKQPVILAVGCARNKIDTYYIAVDKQLIPCHASSSLSAFHELFKCHYVFNLLYAESLVHLYTFVQTAVFNIDVTSTEESPRVRELRAKILNDNV
ncbi:uncharacterized protein LOC132888357 [Neoarius graeffei]|uniref:uncharacterized protein LOC132888357 n=1 Tax=Neoarius graeffei TaxID=443677 RepID=UPI00298CF6CC|nr:uncharacterized protein LOC132888357 [Neoarius graeffei]